MSEEEWPGTNLNGCYMAHPQSVFPKTLPFCKITHTDRCEFKPLLNKSAVRVFQQKEEESL